MPAKEFTYLVNTKRAYFPEDTLLMLVEEGTQRMTYISWWVFVSCSFLDSFFVGCPLSSRPGSVKKAQTWFSSGES